MDSEPRKGTPKRHNKQSSINRSIPARKITQDPLDDPLSKTLAVLAKDDSSSITSRASVSPSILSPTTGAEAMDQPVKDFSYLLRKEIYHPLSQTDVAVPFRLSPNNPLATSSLPTLMASGHFRLAASAAAYSLTSLPPPTSHAEIFSLFYTRLVCLILINAAALAAQEIKALDDLSSAYYRHPVTDAHLAPWELRVLAVRLEGIGYGDGGRAIIGYYDLAREARAEIAKQRLSPKEKETWRARLLDLGLRVANTMIEMNNLVGAVNHLETLRVEAITVNQDDFLRGRLALLYLKIGNINAARKYVTCQSNSSPSTYSSVLEPLISMAEGNYAVAATKLESLKEAPGMLESLVTQNLAVCLLYAGRLNEARILLEELIADGQSFGTLLFNISTVFELCTDRSRNLKVALAEKLASRDGTETGWEKNNADFKL